MKKLKELRTRLHSGIPSEARAIRETAEREDRVLTPEETARVEELRSERERVTREIASLEQLVEETARAESGVAPEARIEVGEDLRTRAPWRGFGEFAGAVARAYTPQGGAIDPRLFAAAQGLNQAIPSEGGFLVPPSYSQTIWDGLNSGVENLVSLTDQYPVVGESLSFNANAETSRATGSRYGGVQGYWIAEADQITKSKPKFRELRLEPKEVAVLIYATNKLLGNAGPALESYLTRAAIDEIGFLFGDAIVNGTGVGKPLGLMNCGCTVSVAKETNQPAATVVQENIVKMWARMHPRLRNSAVWLMNVDVEPQLDLMNTLVKNVAQTENVGGYANKVWDAEKRTLKGRPVIAVEYCQTLGTVGDLILVNLGAYATGVKGGVKSDMSIHLRFDYAESVFRFMTAIDGQSWLASALTPFKGSNTLTSIVTLATRS